MSEKLKGFRWIGTSGPNEAGYYSGCLHVTIVDPARKMDPSAMKRRVLFPGDLCRDPDELGALGAERIEELVRLGYAEYLDVLDKLGAADVLGTARKVAHDSSEADVKATRDAASEACQADGARRAMNELTLRAAAAGDPDARRIVAAPAPVNAINGVRIEDIGKGAETQPKPAPAATGQGPLPPPLPDSGMSARVRVPSWRHPL